LLTDFMELLLNLLWVSMALAAFSAFLRNRSASPEIRGAPLSMALLALACVMVLLFPIVSASDDLHPTQAVLEDATKRIQHVIAPNQQVQSGLFAAVVPALLAASLLFALVTLHGCRPITCEARVVNRERTPHAGRSPPAL